MRYAFPDCLFQCAQFRFDPFQVSLTDMFIVFSLFRVVGNDEPAPAAPFTDKYFFDMEV